MTVHTGTHPPPPPLHLALPCCLHGNEMEYTTFVTPRLCSPSMHQPAWKRTFIALLCWCNALPTRRCLTSWTACRLDKGGDIGNPPVTTTDGSPVRMFQNTDMTNPNLLPELGDSRTYLGHLNNTTYNAAITDNHKLALFHYVTRSIEDYTSRKIKLPSGMYTHNYVRYGKRSHSDLTDRDVMASFERTNGFDGSSPICSSVLKSFYVGQCCSGNP
jgi:hypothetical protein